MAIHKKLNGKYQVDMLNEYGRRIRITFNNKNDAKTFELNKTQIKYDNKLVKCNMKRSRYSYEQALDDFLSSKVSLRPNSKKKYAFFLKQMKYFGVAAGINYLDEFTPDHGLVIFNELVKEKIDPKGNTDKLIKPATRTVNEFIRLLKEFFKSEVLKEHIQKNPVISVKYLIEQKKRPEYYTINELERFFAVEMLTVYRNAFLGFLLTGMRFSELANLKWSDIDFDRKLIHVRSDDGFKTKTWKSERSIPMGDELFTLLSIMAGTKLSDLYPFCSPEGNQLKERKLLKVCYEVAKKASITSRAFIHKFRHSYATHLIRNKVPIESIKELLGHSSVVETEIYAHNKSDNMHSDVSKLDGLLTQVLHPQKVS